MPGTVREQKRGPCQGSHPSQHPRRWQQCPKAGLGNDPGYPRAPRSSPGILPGEPLPGDPALHTTSRTGTRLKKQVAAGGLMVAQGGGERDGQEALVLVNITGAFNGEFPQGPFQNGLDLIFSPYAPFDTSYQDRSAYFQRGCDCGAAGEVIRQSLRLCCPCPRRVPPASGGFSAGVQAGGSSWCPRRRQAPQQP